MGGGNALMLLPLASRFGLPGILLVVGIFIAQRFLCDGSGAGVVDQNAPEANTEEVQFVSFVLDDAQTTWDKIFRDHGQTYRPAQLVVYRGGTSTGCGYGSAAVGPFYCPLDRKVYIDLSFYEQLKRQLGAPGDFAQAYVIAHEIGHHVQNQLGLLEQSRESGPESMSVRQELQADCLAGVWGHYTRQRDLLEGGDLEEALTAAAAIGDDALQRQSGGGVQPEQWTHGSSDQRVAAFRRGFDSGRLEACTGDSSASR